MSDFDENKHPRDNGGKFTSCDGAGGTHEATDAEKKRLKELGIHELKTGSGKEIPKSDAVKVNLDKSVQKMFDQATPQERAKIAFKYIMDNLRGKFPASDGRTISIEKVGAKKMTHTLYEPKIRVVPELHDLIKAGRLEEIKEVDHKIFKQFAYYNVLFSIGNENYNAVLNVGIRDNGDSSLYDINQFKRR